MKKWKIKLENKLLKKISNAVVVEDIIKAKPFRYINQQGQKVEDIKFYLKGKELNPQDLKNLREEIKYLKETMIWKILTNSLREEARLAMNERAENFDDMRQGKLLLYAISLQEKIIDKFK